MSDVNRTLALLRSVLRFAVQNQFILQNPFEFGSSLISLNDEVRRERVLGFDEEERFLRACDAERSVDYIRNGNQITAKLSRDRNELKAVLLTAVDTGMRKGKLLGMKWFDVDFTTHIVTVRAMNSKTARSREIGLTERALRQLKFIWEASGKDPEADVFPTKDFRTAFAAATKEAGIENFRFHDLRHTAITRMVNAGLPPAEIMKISGHTQWTTFARYVNPTRILSKTSRMSFPNILRSAIFVRSSK